VKSILFELENGEPILRSIFTLYIKQDIHLVSVGLNKPLLSLMLNNTVKQSTCCGRSLTTILFAIYDKCLE